MIPENIKDGFRKFFQSIATPLARLHLSPNTLSFLGLVVSCLAAYLLVLGYLLAAAAALVLAGLLDVLDGALARAKGVSSVFGAFWDSTLDRYGEAAIYLGLLIYYWRLGSGWAEPTLVVAVLVGSFMVSYARARAEGLGLECKVGLFSRAERIIILVLGLIVNQLVAALIILAALAHFTALQRIVHVWRLTRGPNQTKEVRGKNKIRAPKGSLREHRVK